MRLVFPDWYDCLAEFESESKGYLEGVVLSREGKDYILNFYDLSRLQQDISDDMGQGFWIMPNLIVVPKVTRAIIEEVVWRLSESDLRKFVATNI